MTEVRQKIRGTTAQLDAILGLNGLLSVDTDRQELRLFDGVLLGGRRIPNLTTIDGLYALPSRLKVDGALVVADANTAIQNGFYRVVGTEANLPVANQGAIWVGTTADAADGDVFQIYTRSTGTYMAERVRSNGAWSAWVRLIDQTFGDTRYLGIGAQAVDAALLNGQNAAFYTNIIARLGYTPLNKAGDTATSLLASADPVVPLGVATKQYVDAVVTTLTKFVRVDVNQATTFTPGEKQQARANIDSPWNGDIIGLYASIGVNSFDITFGSGECMSRYNNSGGAVSPIRMVQSGVLTKRLSSTWVAGGGVNGMIDLTASLPGTGTYFLYIIAQSAAPFGVDFCASLSNTGPVVGGASNIPATWDRNRRIGAVNLTAGVGAAQGLVQNGDEFLLRIPNLDINSAGGVNAAASTLFTLGSLPQGLVLWAMCNIIIYKAAVAVIGLVTAPDQTDSAVGGNIATTRTIAAGVAGYTGSGPWRTDNQARIRLRSDTIASNAFGETRGWMDYRGRFGDI